MTREELDELTEKLKKENDVTWEETENIYELTGVGYLRYEFNPVSECYDGKLLTSYVNWGKTALQKVMEGHRGNFLASLRFNWKVNDPKSASMLASCMKPITDRMLPMLDPIDRATDIVVSAGFVKKFDKTEENSKPLMIGSPRIGYVRSYRDVDISGRRKPFGYYDILKEYVPVSYITDFSLLNGIIDDCLEKDGFDLGMEEFLSMATMKMMDVMDIPYVTVKYADWNAKYKIMNTLEAVLTDEATAKRLDLLANGRDKLVMSLLRGRLVNFQRDKLGDYLLSRLNLNTVLVAGTPILCDMYSEILRMEKFREEKKKLVEEDDWMEIDR